MKYINIYAFFYIFIFLSPWGDAPLLGMMHEIDPQELSTTSSSMLKKEILPPPLAEKPILVLCLHGGGYRGFFQLEVLKTLEEQLQNRLKKHVAINDIFDVISGTSTGGLTSLGLRTGRPVQKIIELYEQKGTQIFSSTWSHWLWNGNGWWGPKYDSSGLKTVLQEIAGNIFFRDIEKPVLIPAYEVPQQKVLLFNNLHAKVLENVNYSIKAEDVALATAAAPTYFPPLILEGREKEISVELKSGNFEDPFVELIPNRTLIDGGVAANDPSELALVEARKLFPNRPVILVAIGTGNTPLPKSWPGEGVFQFLKYMPDTFMGGAQAATKKAVKEELGHNFYEFQFENIDDIALDDTSAKAVQKLKAAAFEVTQKKKFLKLVDRLSAELKLESSIQNY